MRHPSFLPHCENFRSKQEESSSELGPFTESTGVSLNCHGNPLQPRELGIQSRPPSPRAHGTRTGSLAERASEMSPPESDAFLIAEPVKFVDPNIKHAAGLAHRNWLKAASNKISNGSEPPAPPLSRLNWSWIKTSNIIKSMSG